MEIEKNETEAKAPEIIATDSFASADGGTLDFLSSKGEVLLSVAVPPGVVSARKYLAMAPEGVTVEMGEGLALVPASGRAYGVQPYGEAAFETSANPDFKPSSADAMARQLAQLTRQVAVQGRFIEQATRARQAIAQERVADAPKVQEAEVIEDKPQAKSE